MTKILLKGGKVWDGEKFFFADVLTDGEKIANIAPEINEKADFEFDASGKLVSAGLVDIHMHMQGISPDEWGIDATMSCIPFGVTAGADACAVKGNQELLDSFLIKTRVFASNDYKRYGDRAIGIKASVDITSTKTKDTEPLRKAIQLAEEFDGKITLHSSNPPVSMAELFSILRPGDILTHAYHGGTNNVSDDNFECIKTAKKRGVIVDAGLAGHVHTDFKVFADAIKAGAIPDIISTDITCFSAYKRGGRYGMTMCMSIARHLGMSEEDILKATTSTAAKAIGMEKEVGKLEIGRCADIAVLEYADEGFDLTDKAGNRVHSDKGYRNILTIANGEVVYRR